MAHPLTPLLHPRSVAIIGATAEPGRIGGRPLYTMLQAGFPGRLYPVHPRHEEIQGLKAWRSIGALPEPVDCAIIAVPMEHAVETLRACAAAGTRTAIVFTSGFAEIDAAGAAAQEQVAAIARTSGMRILGPNCLGAFTVADKWYGTFSNPISMLRLPPGPIGIVTQSGAYGSHLFVAAQLRGIGCNYWVTTGNEADLTVAEIIEFYAESEDVKVILAYLEAAKDGQRLRRALEAARAAGKPVVFMKVGVTEAGALAAASHTASLAGADAVYEALFRQTGAWRAETTEELVDIAYACQFGHYPQGPRMGLATISGGVGVHMADAATRRAQRVEPLPEAAQAEIRRMIPLSGPRNPVDVTGQALNDMSVIERSIRVMLDQGGYDSLVVYLAGAPMGVFTREACLDMFTKLRRDFPTWPIVLSVILPEELTRTYEALGYACFADPAHAVRAAAALAHFGRSFQEGRGVAALAESPADWPQIPPGPLGEHAAKRLIAAAGLPVAPEHLVTSAEAAVAAWRQQGGGRAVLKIASADIAHKTEIGGVLLGVEGEEAIAAAYATLIARATAAAPQARLDGVLVAPMITGGVECVLGVVDDPVFGPAVMFGLGGILVEVLEDVVFRLAPFGLDEARRMVDSIRGRAILDGVRGAPPVDVAALADALTRLSMFAAANRGRFRAIDINPFLALPQGAVALDALIET